MNATATMSGNGTHSPAVPHVGGSLQFRVRRLGLFDLGDKVGLLHTSNALDATVAQDLPQLLNAHL